MKKLHLWNAIVSITATVVPVVMFITMILIYNGVDEAVEHWISAALIFFIIPISGAALLGINVAILAMHKKSSDPHFSMMIGIIGVALGLVSGMFIVSGIMSALQFFKETGVAEEPTV